VKGSSPRPPWGAAAAVAAIALIGYGLTLAPTVTLWDAGELIAAARTLGIPHPPGTPLFVLLAHVWAAALPAGEYALRTNLLSAAAAALAAGFFFLVVHGTTARLAAGLGPGPARLVRTGGAAAAALTGAFTFTNWQNSNETEVYAVAMLTLAAAAWLAARWRQVPERRGRLLLLAVYLFGLSVANHLLALLAGPALVAGLVAALGESAPDPVERRREAARIAVLAGVWALLVATGLGSPALLAGGILAFAVAAAYAARAGEGRFAGAAFLLAAAGVSAYLFLYLRAGQHPVLNEADPSSFEALLRVVRRAQYPVRTPLDDPTLPHGASNPGRTLGMLWLQLQNYLVYFDWQWARSIEGTLPLPFGALPLHTLVTLGFASLGLRGCFTQRRADRPTWWLLLVLFLVTGLGLAVYMNFKPGFSQAYDRYPNPADHEVRERDYFFVASFVVWGLWAGIGMADLARGALAGRRRLALGRALGALALALVPVALNARAATRRGPDARLAADFAYDLLNTTPPYGVLFTWGDNDTFPLWWAQEVAGIRRDVAVVCLALANTEWYMRQLRTLPARPFYDASAPALWRGRAGAPPAWPLHTMTDAEIRTALPERLAAPLPVRLGPLSHLYPAGTVLYPSDILALRVIQQNIGRRPIVWSTEGGQAFAGLHEYVVQQGLGFRLDPAAPDAPGLVRLALAPAPIDLLLTARLLDSTYRYADLARRANAGLDPAGEAIARALGLAWARLGAAYQVAGDTARGRAAIARSLRLDPNPALEAALRGR
jgi:hypothetical protein